MKFFNAFLVLSFFFFIGCGDGGATRVVEEEKHETVNDNDPTNQDDPTNPYDPTDPDNPMDDPTNPTDAPTNPTEDPTDPADDTDIIPDPDDDNHDVPLTDGQKCVAAGGTWNEFADDDMERCYKIVDCDPKPANSEWNGDSSYKVYYDVNTGAWEPLAYATQFGDGEPQPCRYVCASNAEWDEEAGLCKPYCSAVFDGSSSRIEIQHNDLLNLGDSWTIEGWINQNMDNLGSSNNPPAIVRKGGQNSISYFLTAISRASNYNTMSGGFYYESNTKSFVTNVGYSNAASFNNALKDGWNHIALSYFLTLDSEMPMIGNVYSAHISIYVNGKLVSEQLEENLVTPHVPNQLSDSLIIGYDAYHKKYFNGKIDQLKISTNTYQGGFSPSRLSADDKTIAFWDFNNDTNDASANALNGIGTNITYSTDCME